MPKDRLHPMGEYAWILLRTELEPLGLLTAADTFTFEALCFDLGLMAQARARLAGDGITLKDRYDRVYEHPAHKVYNQRKTSYDRAISEFGLSPSSRVRLETLVQEQEKSLAQILFEGMSESEAEAVRDPLRRLIGAKAAAALEAEGYGTLEMAHMAAREGVDLTQYKGVGPATVRKLEGAE